MYPHLNLFGLSISTYFLIISAASIVGSLWFIQRSRRRGLRRVDAVDLTLTGLIAGFIGARALHVLYEEPVFYYQNPGAVFEIWNGGFVFYGGLIGAWLGILGFCIWRKQPFWFWADIAAPPAALAYALGRIGCFLNGCCYGKICELPWAIQLHGAHRHPTQLYATFWELAVVGILLISERRIKGAGHLFNIWLLLHSVGRIVMEVFRDDPRGGLIGGLTISTWLAVTIIGIALFNLVSGLHFLNRK
jgi:phosphatidylglycerol---prolipoprotein diacylglyceryl transferase